MISPASQLDGSDEGCLCLACFTRSCSSITFGTECPHAIPSALPPIASMRQPAAGDIASAVVAPQMVLSLERAPRLPQ